MLTVFVPFLMIDMRQLFKLDYLWALRVLGAVVFVFRC